MALPASRHGRTTHSVRVSHQQTLCQYTDTYRACLTLEPGWASPAESQVVIVKCFKGLLL
jgi:hypothetical protein